MSKVPDETHPEVIDVTVVTALSDRGAKMPPSLAGRDARRYEPGNRGALPFAEFPNGIAANPHTAVIR